MSELRLDRALVERSLAPSRERAKAWISAGEVLVNGVVAARSAQKVSPEDRVEVVASDAGLVGRGALKLLQALEEFDVHVRGRAALDVGASTGGFTQVLLDRGAPTVHALDVGHGQLAWPLLDDPRVINWERTHVNELPEIAAGLRWSLIVVDCSFISLTKVLPHVLEVAEPAADIIALLKPQFEAGPGRVNSKGVVPEDERGEVIGDATAAIMALGLDLVAEVDCKIHGQNGNVERLLHLRAP